MSPLITSVEFCKCFCNCDMPVIYIKHNSQKPGYHCCIISKRGLFVNSSGYHPLELHGAMNEAIGIAIKELNLC